MKGLSWKVYLIAAFFINVFVAVIMLSYMDSHCDCSSYMQRHASYIHAKNREHRTEKLKSNVSAVDLSLTIAVVIREFEFFENDISGTVNSIISTLPNVKIYLICDNIPYPPIQIGGKYNKNIETIILKPSVNKPSAFQEPFNLIDKDHIFIFPDSVRLQNITQIFKMLEYHYNNPHSIIASPVIGEKIDCMSLNISLRHWTMKYGKRSEKYCNAVQGKHIILVAKSILLQFGFPFSKPFATSLYVQATLRKIETIITTDVSFENGRDLYTSSHIKWKHDVLKMESKVKLYEDLGIKKIIYPASKVEWYGCNKNSNRCFGTVINNMPEYLFHGRWTPPCCLENLRQTARYVFGIMEKCRVRYWLEGGSLLGAVRTGDIIPWDYDVDIGIYREDIIKCEWLKNSLQQSIVDTQGFVWEKAREGDFIRVQFSQSNHLHVDIFPFYSKNGTMTKDTWFVDHKQDMEFPEHFLKPLHKIKFVGITASAPNNYRKFLELKFGQGAIENPQYPEPTVMKFQKNK